MVKFGEICNFHSILRCYYVVARLKGGAVDPDPLPLENHKNIGCFSNTGRDPLNILATKPTFNVGPSAIRHLAFRWRADAGPLMVFGSSPPPPYPLKKPSSSAHLLLSESVWNEGMFRH